jgi:hypothetical protein
MFYDLEKMKFQNKVILFPRLKGYGLETGILDV